MTSVPRSPSWPEITRAEADTTGISPEVAQAESASSPVALTRYCTAVQAPAVSLKLRACPEYTWVQSASVLALRSSV